MGATVMDEDVRVQATGVDRGEIGLPLGRSLMLPAKVAVAVAGCSSTRQLECQKKGRPLMAGHAITRA